MRSDSFTVIAHRGASGYLPEHTLQSAELAHNMGADYIELDVVLAKDDELVVLHDLYLDAISDVQNVYPKNLRVDGRHYVADFTWSDLQNLRVHARKKSIQLAIDLQIQATSITEFRISTLKEMVQHIQYLNAVTSREVGIYIEPKSPKFHWQAGKDIMLRLHQELESLGFQGANCKLYVQSFDFEALKRARCELSSAYRLVALVATSDSIEADTDYSFLTTREGLTDVANYCSGIGPALSQCVDFQNYQHGVEPSLGLIGNAHEQGLFVHGYTLNAKSLPFGVSSFNTCIEILKDAGLDGVFTDHPDLALEK